MSIEKQDDCRNIILLRACQGLVSCHSDLANAMMPADVKMESVGVFMSLGSKRAARVQQLKQIKN